MRLRYGIYGAVVGGLLILATNVLLGMPSPSSIFGGIITGAVTGIFLSFFSKC